MQNSYTLDSDDYVGYLRIEIPRNVADALEDGKVFLSGHVSAKGAQFRVHMNGHGNEHLNWTVEDASAVLDSETRVLTPEGGPSTTSSPKGKEVPKYSPRNAYIPPPRQPAKTVAQVEAELRGKLGMQEHPELISMTWDQARSEVESRKLNWHRKQGILNQYPVDTLVKQDFSRTDDRDLAARVHFVASYLGNERAVSRIASQGKLKVPGAVSLYDWWSKATTFQKLLLLSTKKKIDIHAVNHIRLSTIDCPFGEADLSEDSD
jgi:hypothetical protein